MERGKWQACAMMRLCRKKSDASKCIPVWDAFSDFEVPLICGAGSMVSRSAQIASASQHQWLALRTSTCGLTSGSSGSANSPLRSAFAAH
jgi:hypothetical protein